MASPLSNARSPATPASARPIIDIQAWSAEVEVESITQPLAATHLSPPGPGPITPSRSPRGTSVRIAIPLDDQPAQLPQSTQLPTTGSPTQPLTPRTHHTANKRSSPIRRDSQKRRDALLRGREGSRARRRWENDRLLANPHACAPLPADWDVCCFAGGRETFPYFLAPLWEAGIRARGVRCGAAGASGSGSGSGSAGGRNGSGVGNDEERRVRAGEMGRERQDAAFVLRMVRERIKRSRGAKGLLEDLERRVRDFIAEWDREGEPGEVSSDDDDEEEIVFVGRDASMSDRKAVPESPASTASERARRERLVFESPVEDHGAAFGRWLVHSIATYYGLDTWSVTTGDPARREAYVAVKAPDKVPSPVTMPRPLWGLV